MRSRSYSNDSVRTQLYRTQTLSLIPKFKFRFLGPQLHRQQVCVGFSKNRLSIENELKAFTCTRVIWEGSPFWAKTHSLHAACCSLGVFFFLWSEGEAGWREVSRRSRGRHVRFMRCGVVSHTHLCWPLHDTCVPHDECLEGYMSANAGRSNSAVRGGCC